MDAWLNVDGAPKWQEIEVLYVRWLAPLTNHQSGMNCARLPKIAFVEESDRDAFGFLDPGQVIRGAHLIPAFAAGRGTSSLREGKSFARHEDDINDWEAYYVSIFVDRDMFMRYTHHGVGHPTALREVTRYCISAADLAASENDDADWMSNHSGEDNSEKSIDAEDDDDDGGDEDEDEGEDDGKEDVEDANEQMEDSDEEEEEEEVYLSF